MEEEIKENKSNKKIIIVGIVIGLVIATLIGIIIFLLVKINNNQQTIGEALNENSEANEIIKTNEIEDSNENEETEEFNVFEYYTHSSDYHEEEEVIVDNTENNKANAPSSSNNTNKNNNNSNNNSNNNNNNNSNNSSSISNSEYISLNELPKLLNDTNYFTKYKLNVINNAKTINGVDGWVLQYRESLEEGPYFYVDGNVANSISGYDGVSIKKSDILQNLQLYNDGDYLYIRKGINISQIEIEYREEYICTNENFGGKDYAGYSFRPKLQVQGNTITLIIDENCISGGYNG